MDSQTKLKYAVIMMVVLGIILFAVVFLVTDFVHKGSSILIVMVTFLIDSASDIFLALLI